MSHPRQPFIKLKRIKFSGSILKYILLKYIQNAPCPEIIEKFSVEPATMTRTLVASEATMADLSPEKMAKINLEVPMNIS